MPIFIEPCGQKGNFRNFREFRLIKKNLALCTTDQGFGIKNALSNLMNQIDTPSQVNELSMHFTLTSLSYVDMIYTCFILLGQIQPLLCISLFSLPLYAIEARLDIKHQPNHYRSLWIPYEPQKSYNYTMQLVVYKFRVYRVPIISSWSLHWKYKLFQQPVAKYLNQIKNMVVSALLNSIFTQNTCKSRMDVKVSTPQHVCCVQLIHYHQPMQAKNFDHGVHFYVHILEKVCGIFIPSTTNL